MDARSRGRWRRFGDRTHDRFDQPVRVNPVVRILLALVVLVPGLPFMLFGIASTFKSATGQAPHPVAAVLLDLLIAAMGGGFCYVGWRLLHLRTQTETVLGRGARLVFASFIAVAAIGMMLTALLEGNGLFAVASLGSAAWSCLMFYALLSKRQARRYAVRKPMRATRGKQH